ncbi:hypothetical protein H2202_009775 [Exophiala xenobiotica]|nr:hypothetical protein H2202_009775 [Exophiala xenobiotica]
MLFYNGQIPSRLFSLPPILYGGQGPGQAQSPLPTTTPSANEAAAQSDLDDNFCITFDDHEEISLPLPPPTPPLDPAVDDPTLPVNDISNPTLSPLSPPLPGLDGNPLTNDNETVIVEQQRASMSSLYDAHSTDHAEQVKYVASRLADQLIQFPGCCDHCHTAAEGEHSASFDQHVGLAEYLDSMEEKCPDILGMNRIASREDNLAGKIDAATRRKIFTGLVSDPQTSRPPHICLAKDDGPPGTIGITFDVDSITGFPSDLAVAKQGIRWHPTQMPVSDLRSSLHLRSLPVTYLDDSGHLHQVHRAVHQIPHYTFGRLVGFEDISLYFLFPHLYRETQQSSQLRDHDFRLWMDDILLPIIYQHYSASHVQHYPSSFDHSHYNATARGVETRGQRVDPVSREQQLMLYLPPESLPLVWQSILVAVQQPRFRQFRDVTILFQAKNLKVLTKDTTWDRMMTRYRRYWLGAVDETYVTSDFYFDIAMEICPTKLSRVASSVPPAETDGESDSHIGDAQENSDWATLLWKRCCLESCNRWIQQGPAQDPTAKVVFYPFSMLQESGSLTVETSPRSWLRAVGVLYRQDYPSAKEHLAAGNLYAFANAAMETLALDKSLRRTWELVGGGLSHNPIALMKAYLHNKLRCHFALKGAVQKSTGVRSASRVSRELFGAIDEQCRARNKQHEHLIIQPSRHADSRQPDGVRRVEGLGFRRTMEDFGYAWFLDKVDWSTLTFRQPHAPFMMFKNPSMQAAYHARYGQVRDVRLDFIRMDKAREWMIGFSAVPACLDFLEKYLRQLCLCAFRKDVLRHIKSVLDPEKAEAALAGEVALCYASVKQALKQEYRPPKLAHGNRLGVKSVDVLFAWLWEWKDGQFERKGWDDKPYRMLFRQSYHAVNTAQGKAGARTFRQGLKKSFVRSHWMIPYPQNTGFMRKDKDTKDFVWWPNFHLGLHAYYKQFRTRAALPDPLPTSNIRHHPSDGWQLAPDSVSKNYMPYVVQPEQRLLHLCESELYQELVRFRTQGVAQD